MMNIHFPFHFDSRGHTASANNDDHIRQMIEQLLFTNPGERVNQPDFGSGLQQLVFGLNSPELAAALKFTLQATLQRWLGDLIQLQALDVTSQESTISILIQYIVRRTNEQQTAQFIRTI
jgi:phage baseplate assembly protein W